MASRLSKFRPSTLVSSIAVFIFLSVSTSAEATRCYWCGPLAEQVHRSQRAPSCDIFDLEQQETVCDKGYTHCAIIAVSPPYAESRLCVKFYQDECYSLYCNSTKTWRMVCACRGDLCNGPHTDRETEAFAQIPRFHGKTKSRNKRSLISGFISVKTKTPSDNNTIIIINNKSYNDSTNILQNDQPLELAENTTIAVMNETPKHIDENIIIEHGTFKNTERSITHTSPSKVENYDESKIHNAPPTMPPMENNNSEIVNMDKQVDNAKMDKHINNTEMDKHVENAKTDLDNSKIDKHLDSAKNDHLPSPDNTKTDQHLDSVEMGKRLENTKIDKQLDNAKMDKPTTPILEYTTPTETHSSNINSYTPMKPSSIEKEVTAVHNSVTLGKLPPAEALQQNVTPTKAMELTTIGTAVMSTENNQIIDTTLPSEIKNVIKKNSGTQKLAYLILFVVSFLVHYCL